MATAFEGRPPGRKRSTRSSCVLEVHGIRGGLLGLIERGQGACAGQCAHRQFNAARPNEKWVTDVTEFNVRGDKCCLPQIMDV